MRDEAGKRESWMRDEAKSWMSNIGEVVNMIMIPR
jgi:hypothetical protein